MHAHFSVPLTFCSCIIKLITFPRTTILTQMSSLRQLEINSGSVEGARVAFQRLILHLVKLKNRNAREIRPCPGDWGIDVIVGEFASGACLIWQAKYFPNGVGDPQKAQIRDSFSQLAEKSKKKRFDVHKWYLCVPCALSAQETMWWEKWREKKTKETGIEIGLMDESDIEQILMTPDAKDIRIKFGLEKAQLIPPPERTIKELPDKKAKDYEKSLFIRKLILAGITENMSARCQFFNAELVQKEIHDKGDSEEMAELINLYGKIHSMWEVRFNEALQSPNPEKETGEVYTAMLKHIEQKDKEILASPRILATFVHKQGFMQQLADICKVGWSPDFRKLDRES